MIATINQAGSELEALPHELTEISLDDLNRADNMSHFSSNIFWESVEPLRMKYTSEWLADLEFSDMIQLILDEGTDHETEDETPGKELLKIASLLDEELEVMFGVNQDEE